MSRALRSVPLALLVLVTACSVGPDYRRPAVDVPVSYKELGTWKVAEPRDELARGSWWERYGDPTLSRLEEQAADANQRRRRSR